MDWVQYCGLRLFYSYLIERITNVTASDPLLYKQRG